MTKYSWEPFFVPKVSWRRKKANGITLTWFRENMKYGVVQQITGRICVIGSKLDEDGLRDLFAGK